MIKKKTPNQQKGQKAERLAQKYLEMKGYTFIERNFHAQGGEIDLIMKKDDTFVMVEVKYRSNKAFGGVEETISASKLKKMLRATEHFFAKEVNMPYFQLDIVFVTPKGVRHVPNVAVSVLF